jgi:hypothetical protein
MPRHRPYSKASWRSSARASNWEQSSFSPISRRRVQAADGDAEALRQHLGVVAGAGLALPEAAVVEPAAAGLADQRQDAGGALG